jgi:1-aminocyclopropane-1-carboxylate synthase
MHDWLTEFFERSLLLDHADFTYGRSVLPSLRPPRGLICVLPAGTSLVGSHRLFASLIPFYTTYIHPHVPLEASHIATANGLTTLLDHLASVLCDPGEAFIIPRPYYNAFEADLQGRSEVEVVGVEIPRGQHGEMGEVEALEREMVRRQSEGGARVKAVLVTNPHNPLGE